MTILLETEYNIKKAIEAMRTRYGVVGLNNEYMLAEDIDGDVRIAPMGLIDKLLWKSGAVNPNSFIKIKELLNRKDEENEITHLVI